MTDSMKGLSLSGTLGIQDANVKNGKVNGQTSSIGPAAQGGAPGTTADFTGVLLATRAEQQLHRAQQLCPRSFG